MKRKAPRLKIGDTVAVVAPSGPVNQTALQRGIRLLEEMGYRTKIFPSVYKRMGYLAGSDGERARDFEDAWCDPEVKAVFAARGGYGATRMLQLLDFERMSAHAKILIGYSDITALHAAIWKKFKLVTFHGPVLEIHGETMDPYNMSILAKALSGQLFPGKLEIPEDHPGLTCLVQGEAVGELVGGNLSLVAATIGTPYEIDTRGKILFLEDVGEKPYRIDRMLSQLELSGKLDQASGFLLGDFTECDPDPDKPSLKLDEIFSRYFLSRSKPCIAGVPAGHGRYKTVLPLGLKTRISTDPPEVEFVESALRTR